MLFAMCMDTSMFISLLVFLMILGVVACGVFVLAVVGIIKLIEAWRGRPDAICLSPDAVPLSPESLP